jgi:4-hydroxyphenylpyruvate dioxygenase
VQCGGGEGIQHVALATSDIYRSVEAMRARGVQFQDTPDTYFEGIEARLPGHDEALDELRRLRILIDGSRSSSIRSDAAS